MSPSQLSSVGFAVVTFPGAGACSSNSRSTGWLPIATFCPCDERIGLCCSGLPKASSQVTSSVPQILRKLHSLDANHDMSYHCPGCQVLSNTVFLQGLAIFVLSHCWASAVLFLLQALLERGGQCCYTFISVRTLGSSMLTTYNINTFLCISIYGNHSVLLHMEGRSLEPVVLPSAEA